MEKGERQNRILEKVIICEDNHQRPGIRIVKYQSENEQLVINLCLLSIAVIILVQAVKWQEI